MNHDLPINLFPNACPCCGYATLDARGEYEICTVCWWEDDGQDNDDANFIRGGPNSNDSLTRARINFLLTGIFHPSRNDLRDKQASVEGLVQQRRFVFDGSTSTISEAVLGWSTTIRELDDDESQPLYNVGDHVRVVVNYRNRTPRVGVIESAIWHHKLGIWHYRIVDDAGSKVSKRYAAADLVAVSDATACVTREPTEEEMDLIELQLERLREHFKCWPTKVGYEWDLCRFAYYEGSDRRDPKGAGILAAAAPLALGRELVERHECDWCMIDSSSTSKFGVKHQSLDTAIDLFALDESPLLDPDEHDDDIAPFGPGQGAVESLFAIVRRLKESERHT